MFLFIVKAMTPECLVRTMVWSVPAYDRLQSCSACPFNGTRQHLDYHDLYICTVIALHAFASKHTFICTGAAKVIASKEEVGAVSACSKPPNEDKTSQASQDKV